MIFVERGPDESLARRCEGRQLTRISKNPKFSEHQSFAKRPKRISFWKLQWPLGSFLDAVHEYPVEKNF